MRKIISLSLVLLGLFALADQRGMLIGGAPIGSPTITSPTAYQIVQRNGSSVGSFTVSGTSNIPYTTVEARAVSVTGGSTTAWTQVYSRAIAATGSFTGTLSNVAAGWYSFDLRTKYYGIPNGNASVSRVGVGEVWILGGQSLMANDVAFDAGVASCITGSFKSATNPFSIMVSLAGAYALATDPQPSASDVYGSIVPELADLLSSRLSLPVAILDIAVGGSTVNAALANNWQPGGTNYNTKLKVAVQMFPANGFRDLLWGQGESDNSGGTNQATYTSSLEGIIDQARTDAGWSFPVMVNKETSSDGTAGTISAGIQAAQVAVQGYTDCYAGANIDALVGATYRSSCFSPHPNPTGATAIATNMATAIWTHYSW